MKTLTIIEFSTEGELTMLARIQNPFPDMTEEHIAGASIVMYALLTWFLVWKHYRANPLPARSPMRLYRVLAWFVSPVAVPIAAGLKHATGAFKSGYSASLWASRALTPAMTEEEESRHAKKKRFAKSAKMDSTVGGKLDRIRATAMRIEEKMTTPPMESDDSVLEYLEQIVEAINRIERRTVVRPPERDQPEEDQSNDCGNPFKVGDRVRDKRNGELWTVSRIHGVLVDLYHEENSSSILSGHYWDHFELVKSSEVEVNLGDYVRTATGAKGCVVGTSLDRKNAEVHLRDNGSILTYKSSNLEVEAPSPVEWRWVAHAKGRQSGRMCLVGQEIGGTDIRIVYDDDPMGGIVTSGGSYVAAQQLHAIYEILTPLPDELALQA